MIQKIIEHDNTLPYVWILFSELLDPGLDASCLLEVLVEEFKQLEYAPTQAGDQGQGDDDYPV